MATGLLTKLNDDVWTRAAPLRFLGVAVGTRMTVLRLGDGLLIHSPIEITPDLKTEIDALGLVRFIVAPNLYHHLFAGPASEAWPHAKVLAPKKLRQKKKDLRIDIELEDGPPKEWGGYVDLFTIRGSMLGETVLVHRPSRSLVSADLFENFKPPIDDWITRQYLKAGGIYGKPGWHRVMRFIYRDRKAAADSIRPLLDQELDRIVIAHGDVVTEAPHDTLRTALSFLLDDARG